MLEEKIDRLIEVISILTLVLERPAPSPSPTTVTLDETTLPLEDPVKKEKVKTKEKPAPETEPDPEPEPETSPEPVVDRDALNADLKAMCLTLIRRDGKFRSHIKKLIGAYDVKTITAIPDDKIGAFKTKLERLI